MRTINTSDIKSLIEALAKERKLFWSEADFQFAFACKIQQKYRRANIRLERRQEITNAKKPAYVDIWVELEGKVYPIELKYKTRTYTGKDKNGDVIFIKTHSAWDEGRHSYLKDIERIENFRNVDGFERGFAIIITNDSHYYDPDQAPSGTNDEEFVIHEGKEVKGGALVWKYPKPWTEKLGNIDLHDNYLMHWDKYSDSEDGKGDFKFIITEVCK